MGQAAFKNLAKHSVCSLGLKIMCFDLNMMKSLSELLQSFSRDLITVQSPYDVIYKNEICRVQKRKSLLLLYEGSKW